MDDEAKAAPGSKADTSGEQSNPSLPDQAALLVYTTFPSLDDAKKTGRFLVENALAACVNIVPGMTSVYVWQGAVQEDQEVIMLVKTTAARSDLVLSEIKRLHPYSVPARLVLPVGGGGEDFLDWIAAQCRSGS